MTEQEAKFQYEYRMQTGVLLLLNSPKQMDFGIDLSTWTIGEKFMGIKLIPFGTHFINYSLKDEGYLMKQGFFINVSKDSLIHVRKWNPELQDFTLLKEEEEAGFCVGVNNLDFDAFLGNYPETQIFDWKDLTKYITNKLLDKLEPLNRKYTTSTKEYDDGSPDVVKGTIYFTNIPKRTFMHKIDSKELTKQNIDKSKSLEELIEKEYNKETNDLLGELQYSFITFFLGEVYESFEQWKDIMVLLLSCQSIIVKQEKLYCDFIEVLYNQFRQFPKDFFVDEISSNNFFNKLITNFIITCKQSNRTEDIIIPSSVAKRAILLEKFLKEFFNFEVKDENSKILEIYLNKRNDYSDDDELPVIVDEDDNKLPVIVDEVDNNMILDN
jgi:A1 cistron-splicing factor AAR2